MQMFSLSIQNTSFHDKYVVFCNWIFGTVILHYRSFNQPNITMDSSLLISLFIDLNN
jgi:hypothetical protein